ncbi:MAG TPA: RNase adapter RapZ [Chromatiales bacterium]|nr:RNase adapter RapZ [Chromatiales bacterium]
MRLVVVSGLSGAGKSVALHTLEDVGYYCVDNLPLALLEPFAEELLAGGEAAWGEGAAVAVDARARAADLARVPERVARLRERGLEVTVVFLQAEEPVLIKRFSETRRAHPLARDGAPLPEALARERALLEPIAAIADVLIDTSRTHIHELRDRVRERVLARPARLRVVLQSFGYKHGVPADADLVFDLRCLPNPHWEPALRPLSGRDEPVARFLERQPLVGELAAAIEGFLRQWLPRFQADGRPVLTVALGCTGGQHRSVYMAERLAPALRAAGHEVVVRHRELPL